MWNRRIESDEEGAEDRKPGILARLRAAWEAALDLVSTRKDILAAEAAAKGSVVGRGLVAFVLALVFGWIAFLLLTALLATLLARLLGSVWAGLLATFALYGAAAGAFAFMGVKAFSGFKPFDFPETRKGLREDWEAVRGALSAHPEETDEETDLEARFRAGSE
jgi:hypothetical protein